MAEMSRTTAPVGFAVHQDILNHPVREVDRARHREMWLIVLAVAVLVAVVLVTLRQQAEARELGNQFDRLQKALASEQAEHYRLVVELETLRSLKTIEALATRQLNLVAPTAGESIVIERVRPSAPPAKTLVAQR